MGKFPLEPSYSKSLLTAMKADCAEDIATVIFLII